jgi:predicted acylesterase/phospholipase RssA
MMSELIEEAKNLLRGVDAPPQTFFELAKKLKNKQHFDYARRLLALASKIKVKDPALELKILQQYASCTEKDPDLPIDRRFREAHEIIAGVLKEAETFAERPLEERRAQTADAIRERQETFGIAGAIEKRWWQADGQPQHLVRSLELYEKGFILGIEPNRERLPDKGYTGINAAFVLDLLAQQEDAAGASGSARGNDLRERAREIRTKIVDKLSRLPSAERDADRWVLATLAEACFGLGDYLRAGKWLEKARRHKPLMDPWEYETFVKQLARLAMLGEGGDLPAEDFRNREPWRVLESFVGPDDAVGLLTAFSGKVGLALSGGGFRASLFHIGVLARLAELDMLRHVEVLSCVSGGSIIGALYYLRLRKLLEANSDDQIKREAYVKLVDAVEKEFRKIVSTNARMRVFGRIFGLQTRTERMGELLDHELYGPAEGLKKGERPLLRNLKINPKGTSNFSPKYDNWRRRNKVPILIINATTLNTGHNWQFTATFMGESPNTIDTEVDGNERLRRMYYENEAPHPHGDIPLGRAVAASAAVPGLFRPITLQNLYPARNVSLADGGVHDNQGVGGLLEQDCTVLLVSDASGQMVSEPQPSSGEMSVLMRSNNTLMARVRELEHKDLLARKKAGLLRDFMFVHLKKDLTVAPVNWERCDLPKESSALHGAHPESDDLTGYGVRGRVQNLLSGIRTDLDAFCEAEAFALMASGYKMTSWDFYRSITSFTSDPQENPGWKFHAVERLMAHPADTERFLDILKLASLLLFKGPLLLLGIDRDARSTRKSASLVKKVALICGLVALAILAWRTPRIWLPVGALLLFGAVLATGGVYPIIRLFDRLYLTNGSLTQVGAADRNNEPSAAENTGG